MIRGIEVEMVAIVLDIQEIAFKELHFRSLGVH